MSAVWEEKSLNRAAKHLDHKSSVTYIKDKLRQYLEILVQFLYAARLKVNIPINGLHDQLVKK